VSETAIEMSTARMKAKSGEHILILCRSEYHARQSASNLFETLKTNADRLTGCTVYVGDGSIEFGWAATRSSRRMDDFTSTYLTLSDRWARRDIVA